jgi:MurNAc alpha-1-phosphate uridylyltransferase
MAEPETGLKTAMVLAAGLGKRMRPLSSAVPKPLVQVAGRALIDHCLDGLAAAGVETAVVNVHYLADQLEAHLARRSRPRIVISDERTELLDTGGGIKRALPYLGPAAFFLRNSDSFWVDGRRPNIEALGETWDGERMDALLLLASTTSSIGYAGTGDFSLDRNGRLERRVEGIPAPFAYSGAAILHSRLFAGAPDGPFSLNRLFDKAIAAGRLFGIPMDGTWINVETPAAVVAADRALSASAA